MNCPHCDHPESRVSETKPRSPAITAFGSVGNAARRSELLSGLASMPAERKGWIEDSTLKEEEAPLSQSRKNSSHS